MSTKQSAKPAEQVNADVPQSESPKKSAPLALPAPPAEKDARILDVNEGNVIKLDELGPMVINSDGVSLFYFSFDTSLAPKVRLAHTICGADRLPHFKLEGDVEDGTGSDRTLVGEEEESRADSEAASGRGRLGGSCNSGRRWRGVTWMSDHLQPATGLRSNEPAMIPVGDKPSSDRMIASIASAANLSERRVL
jgi:hypothetical protein